MPRNKLIRRCTPLYRKQNYKTLLKAQKPLNKCVCALKNSVVKLVLPKFSEFNVMNIFK